MRGGMDKGKLAIIQSTDTQHDLYFRLKKLLAELLLFKVNIQGESHSNIISSFRENCS